ncbi:Ala-tRNA(Pro) deacylase [Streptococcus henryi]|uniref:Ala-tRNA(Pro) deacylase n=1 Tax=Streptococcus henryi TaxID=439219 RepID=A0A1G6CN64_9STRE|nr:YbaK/EbsC family protein [Streptococcus henryi]SDB34326.1 Ala-tRNA(Pro) deacylase [Streptococcus henryi]
MTYLENRFGITEAAVYQLLTENGINYKVIEHHPITRVSEVNFTFEGQALKNLLLTNRKETCFYLLVTSADKEVDLKVVAGQLDSGRLHFASADLVMETLGLPVGTVSPFALLFPPEKAVKLVLDVAINQQNTLGFHPARNDKTLLLTYPDFIKLFIEQISLVKTR